MPKGDVSNALNLLVVQYGGDNKSIQEAICTNFKINLTNDPARNLEIVSAANLPDVEKTWLMNYIADPKSLQMTAEKRAELLPVAAQREKDQAKARAEMAERTGQPWDWEKLRDPSAAIGLLIDK